MAYTSTTVLLELILRKTAFWKDIQMGPIQKKAVDLLKFVEKMVTLWSQSGENKAGYMA